MTTTSTLSGAASPALQSPAWAPRPKPTSGSDPAGATFQPSGQNSPGGSADSTDLGALLSQLTGSGQAGATSVNAKSAAQAQSALLTLQEQSQAGDAGASGPHARRGHHGHHTPPQPASGADPSTATAGSITGATTAPGATSSAAPDPSDAGTQLSTWLSQQASAKAG